MMHSDVANEAPSAASGRLDTVILSLLVIGGLFGALLLYWLFCSLLFGSPLDLKMFCGLIVFALLCILWNVQRTRRAPNQRLQLTGDARDVL